MKLFLLSLLSFFITFAPSTYAAELPLNVGGTAPNWTLETSQSESIDYYQDSENKVSVILFWATWCPYCATLMPHLEVIYRKYRNKGVNFYAVDIYEDGEIDPIRYFENKGFTFKMLMDGDEVAKEYGVKGTPALYVVDKDKKVIYKRPTGVNEIMVKQNVDLRIRQALSR